MNVVADPGKPPKTLSDERKQAMKKTLENYRGKGDKTKSEGISNNLDDNNDDSGGRG